MKTAITAFLFFSATILCKAQTNNALSVTDSKTNDKINELEKDKVDTIIRYYVDCIGSMHLRPPDSCLAYDIKYLFWRQNGKHYMQRFDECKEHSMFEINQDIFALLRNNYSEIKIAKIKYPEFKVKEKGKLKTFYFSIDHSCHNIFEIHIGNKIINKDIDDDALETKYVDEKELNRNFYSNKKSILNKLKTVVEHDVDIYNQNH